MDSSIHAGFWRRFAAYFLDGLILFIPSLIVSGIIILVTESAALNLLGSIVTSWLYFALFHSSGMQATPGKAAFGVKVTDTAGERIGFGRATLRYAAIYLSAILLLIGFLLAAFTERRQALHDMIAGTLVVRKSADPDEIQAGSGVMPVTGGVWAVIVLLCIFPFLVGVLAAISIPAYQDYVIRAKVNEVLAEGAALKPEVARMISQKGLPPAGAPATFPARGANLESLTVESNGRIVMTLRNISRAPKGRIHLTPEDVSNGVVHQWRCAADDMLPRYLPPACRQ